MNLPIITRVAALAVVVSLTALPTQNAEAQISVTDLYKTLKKAYDAYRNYRSDKLTLRQATEQVLDAIDSAKGEILAQIDGIAAAEGRACARGVIVNAEDMDAVSQSVREQLAFDGVYCLSLIESLLATVGDKASVDKLGFALNALGPVVKMARAQAGLSESMGVTDMLLNGNYAVIAKLHPPCFTMTVYGDSEGGFTEQNIRCTAYNRDVGWALSWVGDPDQAAKKTKAENYATRNTSRALGQAMIPVITPPPPPPLNPIRFFSR